MIIAYFFQFAMSAADENFDIFEDIDCAAYKSRLLEESGNDQSAADDLFLKNSYDAWYLFYVNGGNENSKYVDGTLGCFCDDQYKKSNSISLYFEEFEVGSKTGAICSEYVIYDKMATYFHILLAICIIIINSIFFEIIVPLVQYIGYHRRTMEVILTCNMIVATFFLDLIVLPIMVQANFREYGFDILDFFKGKFTDFCSDWYPEVGSIIIVNMITFAF